MSNKPNKTELVEALWRKIEEQSVSFEDNSLEPKLRKQFWDDIAAYEEAEWTTSFDLLSQSGVTLPPPEMLNDAQLTAKLWEVVRALAMLRTFLLNTDHLSDRALYETLWHDVLREEFPNMSVNNDSAWQIDLLGSGSEQDNELFLRHYADEETRQHWAQDFPSDVLPAHEALPHNRDRHLPASAQPEWFHQDRPS